MVRKLFLVSIVVGSVIVGYFIWFAAGIDINQETSEIAASAPSAGNFSSFQNAMRSSSWWMSVIPGIVGIIAIILILRAPELPEQLKPWKRK